MLCVDDGSEDFSDRRAKARRERAENLEKRWCLAEQPQFGRVCSGDVLKHRCGELFDFPGRLRLTAVLGGGVVDGEDEILE
jgi:hypothetical protein